MKNLFLGMTIAIILLCGNALAQNKPTADEQAIIALMTNVGKAWDALDAKKFGEFMTEDCTHIDPHGLHTGRDAIVKHLQWVIDNILPKENTKMEVSDFSLRFVGSDVALFGFLGKQNGHVMRQSYVLTKVKNEWKIASFQVTKIEQEKNNAK
jgi:uncharacterized protein (TIGR02246 family)